MKPAHVEQILNTKATGAQKYQKFLKYSPPRIVLQSQTLIPHSSSELLKLFVKYRDSKTNSESDEIDGKEIKDNDGEGGRRYDLRSRNRSSSRAIVYAFHTESQEITISPPPKEIASKDAWRGKKRSHLMLREEEQQEEEVDREEEGKEELSRIDRAPPFPYSIGGDDGVSFNDIGGSCECVDQLKEMVLYPLLYPEFCAQFNITPSRGILLCGPPGTGKTLTARALACEASKPGGTKVSFYMRKGADILSKWVGESEKQLTLLFEEAQRNQPSIIFFDEIDGLAPIRSSKQDQSHNSIVSTLLALMDGLDSRGQVILMGATNRVDAIDRALRRPGRFDREFIFTLPDTEARAQILDIHTRKWKEPPSRAIREELAAACVGYCGADLKALCTEAPLRAFRGRYPQAYSSNDKVLIDADSVKVDKSHFLEAMKTITPAAHRGSIINSRPLSPAVLPCMHLLLKDAMTAISKIFPLGKTSFCCYRPRLLLCGDDGLVLDHVGPAVLHKLERFPVHSLSLPSLLSDPGAKTPEEALMNVVREAKRSTPSILYLPQFNLWWENAIDQLKAVLLMVLGELPFDFPMLLLGTTSIPLAQICDTDSLSIFSHDQVLHLSSPSTQDRSLLLDGAKEAASVTTGSANTMKNLSTYEPHPRVDKAGGVCMSLEDICNRILKDERFTAFHHSALGIGTSTCEGRTEQYPMAKDITTLLQHVKSGTYVTCESFVEEFDLILATVKKHDADKMVIIRAYELRDSVREMLSVMDPTLMIGKFY